MDPLAHAYRPVSASFEIRRQEMLARASVLRETAERESRARLEILREADRRRMRRAAKLAQSARRRERRIIFAAGIIASIFLVVLFVGMVLAYCVRHL
jgi:hypothetical protein